jgi:hypothetical protein
LEVVPAASVAGLQESETRATGATSASLDFHGTTVT